MNVRICVATTQDNIHYVHGSRVPLYINSQYLYPFGYTYQRSAPIKISTTKLISASTQLYGHTFCHHKKLLAKDITTHSTDDSTISLIIKIVLSNSITIE